MDYQCPTDPAIRDILWFTVSGEKIGLHGTFRRPRTSTDHGTSHADGRKEDHCFRDVPTSLCHGAPSELFVQCNGTASATHWNFERHARSSRWSTSRNSEASIDRNGHPHRTWSSGRSRQDRTKRDLLHALTSRCLHGNRSESLILRCLPGCGTGQGGQREECHSQCSLPAEIGVPVCPAPCGVEGN
jgi:hypothetical protein